MFSNFPQYDIMKQETEKRGMGRKMELVRPRMGHFKAVMAADRDFESAGESRIAAAAAAWAISAGWPWWTGCQARVHGLWQQSQRNLVPDERRRLHILAFGQLRPYDTPDALTWAGHIGYMCATQRGGHGYAQETLKRLLQMGFDRGMGASCSPAMWTTTLRATSSKRRAACSAAFTAMRNTIKRLYWFTKKG